MDNTRNIQSAGNAESVSNHESVTKKQRPGKKSRTNQKVTQPDKARRITSKSAVSGIHGTGHTKNVMGFDLNAQSARTAMVLSEILGPPLSRRKRGR